MGNVFSFWMVSHNVIVHINGHLYLPVFWYMRMPILFYFTNHFYSRFEYSYVVIHWQNFACLLSCFPTLCFVVKNAARSGMKNNVLGCRCCQEMGIKTLHMCHYCIAKAYFACESWVCLQLWTVLHDSWSRFWYAVISLSDTLHFPLLGSFFITLT